MNMYIEYTRKIMNMYMIRFMIMSHVHVDIRQNEKRTESFELICFTFSLIGCLSRSG